MKEKRSKEKDNTKSKGGVTSVTGEAVKERETTIHCLTYPAKYLVLQVQVITWLK